MVVGVVAVVVAVAVMFFDPLRALRARLFNSSSGYCHSFVGLDRQIGSSSPALDENGTICDNGVHTHTRMESSKSSIAARMPPNKLDEAC